MAARNSADVAVFRFTFLTGAVVPAVGDVFGAAGVATLLAFGCDCEFKLLELQAVTANVNVLMNKSTVNRLFASRDIDTLPSLISSVVGGAGALYQLSRILGSVRPKTVRC